MRVLATMLAAAAFATAPSISHAQPCEAVQPEAGVPVRTQMGPADFATVPEACGAYELSLRGRMAALIAEEDFYGRLYVAGAIGGRLPLPGGSWLSAQLPGAEYRFVANASVEAQGFEVSATTLGWHLPWLVDPGLQLAPYVRAMLPTETVLDTGTRYGFEQGVSFVASPAPAVEMMGGYALPVLLTTTGGHTHTVLMPAVGFDVGLRPWSWSEAVLGIGMRRDSIDPRVALRFYPWHRLLIDLSATFPVLGHDRTLLVAGLTFGWLFTAVGEDRGGESTASRGR